MHGGKKKYEDELTTRTKHQDKEDELLDEAIKWNMRNYYINGL